MTAYNYCTIAKAGGNLVIQSKDLTAYNLTEIASACKEGNSSLTIIVNSELNAYSCEQIAKKNPGKVTFQFCA